MAVCSKELQHPLTGSYNPTEGTDGYERAIKILDFSQEIMCVPMMVSSVETKIRIYNQDTSVVNHTTKRCILGFRVAETLLLLRKQRSGSLITVRFQDQGLCCQQPSNHFQHRPRFRWQCEHLKFFLSVDDSPSRCLRLAELHMRPPLSSSLRDFETFKGLPESSCLLNDHTLTTFKWSIVRLHIFQAQVEVQVCSTFGHFEIPMSLMISLYCPRNRKRLDPLLHILQRTKIG